MVSRVRKCRDSWVERDCCGFVRMREGGRRGERRRWEKMGLGFEMSMGERGRSVDIIAG